MEVRRGASCTLFCSLIWGMSYRRGRSSRAAWHPASTFTIMLMLWENTYDWKPRLRLMDEMMFCPAAF